jgi:hypothetical protein
VQQGDYVGTATCTALQIVRMSIENVRKKGIAPSRHVSSSVTSGSDENVRETNFVSFIPQRRCVEYDEGNIYTRQGGCEHFEGNVASEGLLLICSRGMQQNEEDSRRKLVGLFLQSQVRVLFSLLWHC